MLPLVERIQHLDPSEVVLCPHGPLSLLPMHAIKCKDRTIIERWPVTYLPSPTFAGELTRLPKSTRSDALLLANPTGGLHGAEDEIRDVEKWLKRNAIESRCFSGSDATSARVLEAAPTASIFHFACHAQFDVEDFAKSGLVLADGRLTVRQLSAGVEMPKASLIFLSTCESARSNPGRIDELLALSRVFFCAGCPTVIASLWELEDVSASTFVDVFYKSWLNDKQTIAVAFREAALKTKELHPNPREWAALISVGAWR